MWLDLEGAVMIVEFIHTHTHAGVVYRPGDRADLPSSVAEWLVSVGAARAAPPIVSKPKRARLEKGVSDGR